MDKKLGRLLRPVGGLFYIGMLAVFSVAAALLNQYILAGVGIAVTCVELGVYLLVRVQRKRQVQNYLQELLEQQDQGLGTHTPFPMAVIRLADEEIIYSNEPFHQITGYRDTFREQPIGNILPGFDTNWLTAGKTEYPYDVTLQKRRYRIYGMVTAGNDPEQTRLGVLYFTDLTELYQVRDEYIRSRPVVAIILVDNYDELTKNLTEGAISSLSARINDAITQWTEGYHGLLRRLEKNRFLFVFEKRDLRQAMEEKFTVLEAIHEITNPAGLAASLSIGLGVDGATFEESYDFASLSIEMALSRGGDQAVVKDRLNFTFFGGRTREAEHRSKVRSRVTANSLMELIGQSSRVFIMGHKNADMDAVGAAVGVSCMCRKKGKPFHIVLDLERNVAKNLVAEIRQVPEYKNAFISSQEASSPCSSLERLISRSASAAAMSISGAGVCSSGANPLKSSMAVLPFLFGGLYEGAVLNHRAVLDPRAGQHRVQHPRLRSGFAVGAPHQVVGVLQAALSGLGAAALVQADNARRADAVQQLAVFAAAEGLILGVLRGEGLGKGQAEVLVLQMGRPLAPLLVGVGEKGRFLLGGLVQSLIQPVKDRGVGPDSPGDGAQQLPAGPGGPSALLQHRAAGRSGCGGQYACGKP